MRRTLFLLLLLALPLRAVPTQINVSKLTTGTITVDGDLTDSGWQSAQRVERFFEYNRGDNQTPPTATTGMLTYDSSAVYVAFHAVDPNPRSIRAPFVDRDKVLGDQDYVGILIDTQNDHRAAIAFKVNARGIETDSVINGANGNEDFSPDFFFEAVARETPDGWAAEIRIPLSSLRYPDSDPQTWGVILLRNYPRDFRYVMANTPIAKASSCFICNASELTGLTGLPAGGHLTVTPYATANRDERRHDGVLGAEPLENEQGLDLKWSPSKKLTLDGTLNPDFSQIESDVPQLDVNNRFALAYPEKRTFFLEGVDLLSTPVKAVYTRTITAPAWGMRATGESAAGAYTMLVAEDRGGGGLVLPGVNGSDVVAQDFRSRVFVGRLRKSFGSSYAGVLATAREIEGGGHNRIFGPDLFWKDEKNNVQAQVLFSTTTNPERRDLAAELDGRSFNGSGARVVYRRDTKRYDIWSEAYRYSSGFRADDGFVPQVGVRREYFELGGHVYPKRGFFSYVRPYMAYGQDHAVDGGRGLWNGVFPGFWFEGKWGSQGWITYRAAEREHVKGRDLDYSFLEWWTSVSPVRWLPALELSGNLGQKVDYSGGRLGDGGTFAVSTTLRPTDHLQLELRSNRQWLDLDEGRLFTARVDWAKLTYMFTARSLVRLIAQQSDVTRDPSLYASSVRAHDGGLSFSGLYGYKLNFQTVFFVGFGDASAMDPRERMVRNARSVFMKVAYAIQR